MGQHGAHERLRHPQSWKRKKKLKNHNNERIHRCRERRVGGPDPSPRRGDAAREEPGPAARAEVRGSLRQALGGRTFQGEGAACAEALEKQRPRRVPGSAMVEKRSDREERGASEEAGASHVGGV